MLRFITSSLRGIYACALFAATSLTFGQTDGQVLGQIKDATGAPLQFAAVALVNEADKPVIGTISDERGNFNLSAPFGEYALQVTSVGYKPFKSARFSLNAQSATKSFPGVSVEEDVEVRHEVEVTALCQQITLEADKMIVSIEGTAMAEGANAFEMSEKSPEVFVDQDGNIQLNGRNIVRIMVDGRPTYMSAQDLRTFLQGMSANTIKQIELVSNP